MQKGQAHAKKMCIRDRKELTNEENLPGVLKKLCFTSLDDMYAAIGYGGISALKVIGRLREDIQRIGSGFLALLLPLQLLPAGGHSVCR